MLTRPRVNVFNEAGHEDLRTKNDDNKSVEGETVAVCYDAARHCLMIGSKMHADDQHGSRRQQLTGLEVNMIVCLNFFFNSFGCSMKNIQKI